MIECRWKVHGAPAGLRPDLAHGTVSAHPDKTAMKDSNKRSPAVPASKTKEPAKTLKKDQTELSPEDRQGFGRHSTGGKLVNGKRY